MQQLKRAITVSVLLAIGIVTIAWSHAQGGRQPVPPVETISPESLPLGHGSILETKFRDMSVVFTGDN
jgi:hypothetical protein